MYSTEIRKIANLLKYAYMNVSPLHNKTVDVEYNSTYLLKWDINSIKIMSDDLGTITLSNSIQKTKGDSLDNNYISTNTKRIAIFYDHTNFKSYFDKTFTPFTRDVVESEASYFQHSLFADLPEYEELKDVHDICKELVEMKLTYVGTYRMPSLNLLKIIEEFEEQHPETKGYWEGLKNVGSTKT